MHRAVHCVLSYRCIKVHFCLAVWKPLKLGYFAGAGDEPCLLILHCIAEAYLYIQFESPCPVPSHACVAIWGIGAPMSSLSSFFTFSHSNPLPFLSSSSSALHSRHARYIGVGVCLSREGEKQRTGQMFNFGCVSAVRIRSLSLSFVFGAKRGHKQMSSPTQRLPPSLPHFRPVFASATNKERVTSPSTSFAAKFHLRTYLRPRATVGGGRHSRVER